MYNPPTIQLNRFSSLSSVIGFKTIYWAMSRFVRTHIAHVSSLFSLSFPVADATHFLFPASFAVKILILSWDMDGISPWCIGSWRNNWTQQYFKDFQPKIIQANFSFFLCISHIVKKNCITHYHL